MKIAVLPENVYAKFAGEVIDKQRRLSVSLMITQSMLNRSIHIRLQNGGITSIITDNGLGMTKNAFSYAQAFYKQNPRY